MKWRDYLSGNVALLLLMGSVSAENAIRPWRVAFVSSGGVGDQFNVFRDTLRSLGYEVGKNLLIDVREAQGNNDLLPNILKDVVNLRPDVIVAEATPAVAAAKKATSTIPIVMSPATDPIGSGFVESYSHPGRNITGLANMYGDLTAKTLDILHLVLPRARKIGILISSNPTHPALFQVAREGAEKLGISAERFIAERPDDLDAAFNAMKRANCEAVYVLADPPRAAIPKLARSFALPVIYQNNYYVERMDGLISYGPDVLGFYRRAADYVDRILKGKNPADLPVEQPTTFQFIVNVRTAKTLGLIIPEEVLAQADKVIE
jgi:putative ABC transport system substrate-binding protein